MMDEAQVKDLLKRAYDRISALEEQIERQRSGSSQDIAIVGISLRYPQVNSLEDLHLFLDSGECGVKERPEGRWNSERWLGTKGEEGKAYTFAGGYLDQIEFFDHHFFNVPAEEAKHTDPQQRILLELAVEAIQHSGILLNDINGSSTAVYVGTVHSDFDGLMSNLPTEYSATGSIVASASGRLAYKLNLKGPVLSLDTACSSSLAAIHLAGQSLLNNECDYALAGGINLILSPKGHIGFSQLGAMAVHGRCKTFSNDAIGFGRGEGGGFVFLRRASDAIRDGNRILGIVKGTAMNHDGQSNGYTAPSQKAQEAVIVSALQKAGVSPMEIGYIEAHGTGTSLGDAIELQALHSVFQYAPELHLGSIKANLGHTEYAAGIASVAKALLSLRKKRIYPQIAIEELNKNFHWDNSPLKVNRVGSLEKPGLRYAGVSGFGISGTNIHAVLGEAGETRTVANHQDYGSFALFCSARTRNALRRLLEIHLVRLENMEAGEIPSYLSANTAYRDHFEYRMFVAAHDKHSLLEEIRMILRQETDIPLLTSPAANGKIVFLFSGQGGQWTGMGRALYTNSPYFKSVFDEVSREFEPVLGFSISENMINASETLLRNETSLQPALFALQVSLAKLWMFYGYRPECVMGISLGEISAAYVAGSLCLKDAVRIISLRSYYLVKYVSGTQFCMAELDEHRLKELMHAHSDVEIAGYYSENSYLLASGSETLDLVQKELDELGLYCRRAETTVASHCSSIEVFLELFANDIADVAWKPAHCKMFSTAYGRWMKPGDFSPSYWKDNLRNPFQFYQAQKELLKQGFSIFTEISLHPLTSHYFLKGIQRNDLIYQPSLFRETNCWHSFVNSVRSLYQKGVNPAYVKGDPDRIDLLPLYPWDKGFFEIPYDNYGQFEGSRSRSMEYLLPEWKPVAKDKSDQRNAGDIMLVGFHNQKLFNASRYLDPDDVVLKLGSNPQSTSTVILDLHAVDDKDGIARVMQWVQTLSGLEHGSLNLVFLVSRSIRVSGLEDCINDVSYGWLGYTRSLKTEWEKGSIQWVDTDGSIFEELIEHLSSEDDPSDPFCVRGARKYKLHVRSESLHSGSRRNPESALIIGGTSEMGLLMAAEYVRLGAKKLVLHGKRPVQPEGAETDPERDRHIRTEIRKWESEGVKVHCTSGDLSSPQTIKSIQDVIQENTLVLDDFVLAAGTSEYISLLDHSPADFIRQIDLKTFQWKPIVESTKPKRVIFISSASGMFNSPGQGAYLFSNHVLDAWASGRKDVDQEAFTILFPIWKDFGKSKEAGFLPETMLEHVSRNDLAEYFRHLIGVVDPPPVVIAASPANNSTRGLWRKIPFIPEGRFKHRINEIIAESPSLPDRGIEPTVKDDISLFVTGLWHDLLGERDLLGHHHFFQLGGNSVLLVKLSNRVKERYSGIDINVRDLIQNLTFQEQIDLIRSRVHGTGKKASSELTLADPREMYLASEEQKQIWIQNQLDDNASLYNLTGVYSFTGQLNVHAFEKAVMHICEEQEIFRTRYLLEEGLIYQKIDGVVKLTVHNIEFDSIDELDIAVKDIFRSESCYPFDLEEEHPFRIHIVRSGNQGAFILNLHHIAADGWALGYYTRRLDQLYTQYSGNVEPEKKIPEIHYKDYCVYQQEIYLPGEQGSRDEDFWMKMVKSFVSENYLLQEFERSATYSYSGEKMKRSIDPSLFERMLRLKNAAQVSLFSYMQASLSLLLCLTSGKKSIVTGSPFSSRMDKRLEDVVGNFVNLLPIHIHIEERDTLRDHISKVQLSISKVMQHQSYPFNLMVQKSGFKRDPSRHPLFDILFVLQNHEEARFELNGMEIERKFIDPEHSKLDLFIELREVDGTLEFNFEYNDLIFTQDLIEDFFSNWKNLLEYMSGNPETSIAEVVSHYSLSNERN